MEIKVSKIMGAKNDKNWCQVHEFKSEDENKLKKFGHLMAALAFKAKNEDIEVSSFGTEMVKRLQELYYSNKSDGVIKKMSQTMESLASEFLIEVDLEMVLMVVLKVGEERVLYAGRKGQGQVVLKRDGQLVELLVDREQDMMMVSGKLKQGDEMIAGTSQFFEIVSQGVINSALEQKDQEMMIEKVAAVLHGHEKNSRSAGVVAQYLNNEPESLYSPGKIEKDSSDSRLLACKKLIKNSLEIINKRFERVKLKTVRVRDRDPKKQKSAATIAMILVLVFGVSLVMAGRKRQKTKQEEKVKQVLEEVNYKYDEALNLIELNPLRAKALLKEVQEKTRLFESESKNNRSEELEELAVKIEEALGRVSREYEVESASEWFDFSLVKEDFKGSDFEAEENKLLVWDQDLKTAIEIDLVSKSSRIVIGGDKVSEGSVVGLAGERGFVIGRDMITVLDMEKTEVVAEVSGDEWGDIKDAVGFSSNLYLLDGTSNGQILKYLGVNSGLSAKRNYLTGEDYDFSEAVSMAIDGSIWVLFKDGTIVKYVRGVKDAFNLIGLDKGFEEPIKIYTTPEVNNLYILDRRSMRVVVVAKNGEYQAQYVWPGIAGVTDLVASEELKRVFLLTREKVFVIELRP